MSTLEIFKPFWAQYTTQNPHAKKIHDLFVAEGEEVINDHIALRTYNDPRVNIETLSQYFLKHGYISKGEYDFPNKKLFARHFEHQNLDMPKVFISELKTEDFSLELQEIVKNCIDKIPESILTSDDLALSGIHWEPLDYDVYEGLLSESEYAAWMYAFGFCANHFTVNVNRLKHFNEIADVNTFLKKHGFQLNASGGEVKGTPADFLEQSSTLAERVKVEFKQGIKEIPSCYYEFAKRYETSDGKLYTGFVAASADKIFESTDVKR
ncbi:MAG: DUF1338 domain-containing protein [Gammaproteobacteria bacterium]